MEMFLQHVSEPYFTDIAWKRKTHEGKSLSSNMAREVKKGDLVKFFTGEKLVGESSAQCYERLSRQGKVREAVVKVVDILTFPNFEEMLKNLGPEMMISDSGGDLEYALIKYHEFGVDTDDRALAFHINVIYGYI